MGKLTVLCAAGGSAGETIRSPAPSLVRPCRMLVAEDLADNRLVLQTYFRNLPIHFEFYENGKLALDRVQADSFDLILMDIQMPLMDGYAATRAIREWEERTRAKRVPIVALTAYARDSDVEKALQAGCDSCISKPLRRTDLIAEINRRLKT